MNPEKSGSGMELSNEYQLGEFWGYSRNRNFNIIGPIGWFWRRKRMGV